jgi:formylglycine-generating enzyme required for sulfatase activity
MSFNKVLGGIAATAAALLLSSSLQAAAPKAGSTKATDKPGATFKECADCPTMVVIPSGTFMMGSADSDTSKNKGEESPQHQVAIAKPYAMGQTHVTRAQFAKFVKDSGYKGIPGCNIFPASGPKLYEDNPANGWADPGFKQTQNDPAVCVSWDDAQAYIAWLNKKVGKDVYRLPTEAEWEFAARGGTTSKYFWGEDRAEACKYASAADLSGKKANPKWDVPNCDDGYVATAPVASFKPNPYGLYDIVGNAWQWTQDCWHESYNGAPADGSAWMDPGTCKQHASRGGSWRYDPIRGLRSASRGMDPHESQWASVGFRVARTVN